MKTIDLFYQGEGVQEIEHLEICEDATFSIVREQLKEKHNISDDTLLFLEDQDEPIDDSVCINSCSRSGTLKFHFHRQSKIKVAINFNSETIERHFPPSTTIARLKHWAAERKFAMTEEEASEHVLQISGTHERPSPAVHIGSLVECNHSSLSFDLVPDERINGALEE